MHSILFPYTHLSVLFFLLVVVGCRCCFQVEDTGGVGDGQKRAACQGVGVVAIDDGSEVRYGHYAGQRLYLRHFELGASAGRD